MTRLGEVKLAPQRDDGDALERGLRAIAESIYLGEDHPLFWVATAIKSVFISPNERDRNMEPANVVDGLYAISRSLFGVADAIREHGGQAKPKAPPSGLRPIEARMKGER
jgi:hypothetical protein